MKKNKPVLIDILPERIEKYTQIIRISEVQNDLIQSNCEVRSVYDKEGHPIGDDHFVDVKTWLLLMSLEEEKERIMSDLSESYAFFEPLGR